MDWRRRRDRKDYFLPEDEGMGPPSESPETPEPSKPSESTDSPQIIDEPEPSGVITVEERLRADPDAYTLEPEPSAVLGEPVFVEPIYDPARVEREEAYRTAKAESDRIKAEQMAEGQDTVTHMGIQMTREQYESDFPEETISDVPKPSPFTFKTTLPDPDTFVGIPGPASRPREGSIREKIQEKIDTSLQTMETAVVDFETEMYRAGREMGAEAQEAYKEEDYTEAFLKGMVAFSARTGVGIVQGASFLFRPLAWAKTGEALVLGAKDVIEHPEDVPSGIQKWAGNIAIDPASIAQFGGGIAGGYLTGSVIGEAYRSWKIRRLSKFYAEFPEEAFYIEDGIPDPRIPHPTDVERLIIKSKEQVKMIDDLGAGFLDEHKIATGSWPKSGTKGFGLRRTGHDLIPELIPEGMGRLETVYRFGLEYGQTHLPGVTGLPPYFEAALGLSPLIGVAPSLGAISGLLSGISTLDKPLPDSKPDIKQVTPTFDDTGIDEKPRIIERVDETYKTKPKLTPPLTTPKPVTIIKPIPEPPFITPIIDPILEEDTDITTITIQDITTITTPKPIQETIKDTILDIPPIIIPRYMRGVPKPRIKVPIKLPKKKRKRRKQKLPPLGWELRKYKMPTLEASKSTRKKPPSLKLPFPENKKKKKPRLPKL